MRPYIGITGVTDAMQMEEICAQFEKHLNGKIPHQGMTGILCSPQTLNDEQMTPRHIANVAALRDTMRAAHNILPMLHIELDKQPYNHTPFADDVSALLNHTGRSDIAVQLNGLPCIDEIDALRQTHPETVIVFQVRQELIRRGLGQVLEFLEDVGADEHAGYTLIDPSAGTGRSFNTDLIRDLHTAIYEQFPLQTIGMAGGLHPDSVYSRIRDIAKKIDVTNLCIDIETGVHSSDNDVLDLHKTDSYIQRSVAGFSGG